jgi:hypothetical protein
MQRLLLLASLLSACNVGGATLAVRVYGEEFIEAGIPAEVFSDGWAVGFDKFLITVGEIEAAKAGDDPESLEPGFLVFDLTRGSGGGGHVAARGTVPYGLYDETRFLVAPAADAEAGNASEADLKVMRDGGFSVYVAGRATKADVTMNFAWGFATRTRYTACESSAEVRAGLAGQVELTIHGDHLFYDDLFSETPKVTFDLIADADADGDGTVTQAELTAVDLRPLANYQVGSTEIVDLWHFIEHLTSTLGHINGEGHCEATRES